MENYLFGRTSPIVLLLFLLITTSCAHQRNGGRERKPSEASPEVSAQTVVKVESEEKSEEALMSQGRYHSLPMADVHFHVRNYIQNGITLNESYTILRKAGVKRAAVFGIPLQQRWDMETDISPSYYLHDDQSLYYYSAIDAMIAIEYQSLPSQKKGMFDPMIVGFNPTDGRAVDHIRNMLLKFPNTFTGIGEFSIKKEIVSGKIAGGAANIGGSSARKNLRFCWRGGACCYLAL